MTYRDPATITERNPVFVVILSMLTLSVYAFYWLYITTKELSETTGRRDLDPLMDLLLAIVTFGLWGIYAGYRNARIVHSELHDRGIDHEDRSLLVAASGIASVAIWFCWVVGVALLQDDLNALARADAGIAPNGAPLPVTY